MGALKTWGFGSCVFSAIFIGGAWADTEFKLNTSIGMALAPETRTSVTLEPQLGFETHQGQRALLGAVIDRPIDPHENYSVPKIALIGGQRFFFIGIPSSILLGFTLIDVDRWALEGVSTRLGPSYEASGEIAKGLSILFRIGTYLQFNEYAQKVNGNASPRYGFTQRLTMTYLIRKIELEARLIVEERNASGWKNDYMHYEAIGIYLADRFKWGLSHELLSSVIDSTGLRQSPRFVDSRQSRFSTYLEVGF